MRNLLLVNKQEKKMGVYELDFYLCAFFLPYPLILKPFFDILSARNHPVCKHNVLYIKKTSSIPSYINESVTSS